MASSKTSATPFCSLAEHSTYLAPMRLATAWPCSGVTGVRPCVRRSSMQARLWRRSDLRPTRIRGVVGQKWRTSGYHFAALVWRYLKTCIQCLTLSITFSNELGQSIAKQTNRRSVSGYDNGLSRSYSSCPAVSHKASSTVLPEAPWVTCVM